VAPRGRIGELVLSTMAVRELPATAPFISVQMLAYVVPPTSDAYRDASARADGLALLHATSSPDATPPSPLDTPIRRPPSMTFNASANPNVAPSASHAAPSSMPTLTRCLPLLLWCVVVTISVW
jgi:hypothetical protein